ncbi:MAG: sulfate ABC transporter substrate-binding protein [Candidatus Pacebacteria bacterium]|nr:sulfate ABC transporter substrate-binding protein [Candidatus Paceibacterota bacterium]
MRLSVKTVTTLPRLRSWLGVLSLAAGLGMTAPLAAAPSKPLLVVSFDSTRELLTEINQQFNVSRKAAGQTETSIRVSNGASGAQARAVMSGLDADLVLLSMAPDIQVLADQAKLLPADWQSRWPNGSSPFYSTIVFLVRQGNPKKIHDWGDLIKGDVKIITPNPKTSGAARFAYLAAYGAALQSGKTDAEAREYLRQFYSRVLVLDSGSRAATTTFAEREQGDVMVSWESEARLAALELKGKKFEIVTPKISIKADPVVAAVDANVKNHQSEAEVTAFIKFLFEPPAQAIIAKHNFRPRLASAEKIGNFPKVKLFTVEQQFGGWPKAIKDHFADGGSFDQVYAKVGEMR